MVRAVNIFNALNAALVQEDDIYSSDRHIERQKIRYTDLNSVGRTGPLRCLFKGQVTLLQ